MRTERIAVKDAEGNMQEREFVIEKTKLLSLEEFEMYRDNIPELNTMWWLRTSAGKHAAVCIATDNVDVHHADIECAIRPALQLSGLSDCKIGDNFEFKGHTWTVISDDCALCDEAIGRHPFRRDWRAADSNAYEVSDVKKYIEDWYNELECHYNKENGLIETEEIPAELENDDYDDREL